MSEIENPPLCSRDIKQLKLKDMCDGATNTEFNGLLDLRASVFEVKVPRGSNIVSARWVFA